ncbi:hypothetical protein HHI36_023035 [Cryptolaemus montrouzieri]|uniref:Uncharacterized protein n=1 Tax=Cryptolaemus montrouzieri TaxID=559131 RepID=A0ABD2PGR5_9CUCU
MTVVNPIPGKNRIESVVHQPIILKKDAIDGIAGIAGTAGAEELYFISELEKDGTINLTDLSRANLYSKYEFSIHVIDTLIYQPICRLVFMKMAYDIDFSICIQPKEMKGNCSSESSKSFWDRLNLSYSFTSSE